MMPDRRFPRRPRQARAKSSACPPALLARALALRAPTPERASGRCLHLSLELARAADRLGVGVSLVHWRLRDDPLFCEHWAVLLPDDLVLDLTRVQVDGQIHPLHRLRDYPQGFAAPVCFPVGPILALFEHHRTSMGRRLPSHFLRALRLLMLRHELGEASRRLDARRGLAAVRSYLEFLCLHRLTRVHQALIWRESELRQRSSDPGLRAPRSASPAQRLA